MGDGGKAGIGLFLGGDGVFGKVEGRSQIANLVYTRPSVSIA